jgi:hypothetical protein
MVGGKVATGYTQGHISTATIQMLDFNHNPTSDIYEIHS